MNHKQKMTYKQRMKLSVLQYKRMIEEKRGHNYEYWNEEKHNLLLKNGWQLVDFSLYNNSYYDKYATLREDIAKHEVEVLRSTGHYARIVCGYSKNIQKIKMYSVIYKQK